MKTYCLAAGLLALLAACGDTSQSYDGASVSEPFVVDPAGGRDVAMAGMKLRWGGPDGQLVAASSPSAERVEIHTHSEVGGVMQMRQVDSIYVTSGLTFEFGSGGDHLMLFGFDEALAPGDDIRMTLTFETGDGTRTDVEEVFPVIGLGDLEPASHH